MLAPRSLLVLRPLVTAFGLVIRLLAVMFRLAYRELHEGRGEAVRCATALCNARFASPAQVQALEDEFDQLQVQEVISFSPQDSRGEKDCVTIPCLYGDCQPLMPGLLHTTLARLKKFSP